MNKIEAEVDWSELHCCRWHSDMPKIMHSVRRTSHEMRLPLYLKTKRKLFLKTHVPYSSRIHSNNLDKFSSRPTEADEEDCPRLSCPFWTWKFGYRALKGRLIWRVWVAEKNLESISKQQIYFVAFQWFPSS